MENKNKFTIIMAIIATSALILGATAFVAIKFIPNKTMANIFEYYEIDVDKQENLSEFLVFIEGERYSRNGIKEEGVSYLDYDLVYNYICEGFYYDSEEKILSFTTTNSIIRVEPGSSRYSMNGETFDFHHKICFLKDETLFLSFDFVNCFENIEYSWYGAENSLTSDIILDRLMLRVREGGFLFYETTKETTLRVSNSVKAEGLVVLKPGTKLWCLRQVAPESRRFAQVTTLDGITGYVMSKDLNEAFTETFSYTKKDWGDNHILKDEKIILGWHAVDVGSGYKDLYMLTKDATSMNVISPTWIKIVSEEGTISSRADEQYVEYAHSLGFDVWILADDFSDAFNTDNMLSSTKTRDLLCERLIDEALRVGADGINIDFEYFYKKTHFTEFIKELSVRCHQKGLVLSVDDKVPASYNSHYDYETQAKYADYIIIMAYDEHYAGSKEAGSVASYNFVKNAVTNTLKYVPEKQTIMAIPFYTRLWCFEKGLLGTDMTSKAISMVNMQAYLDENGISSSWDEETRQFYSEYTVDNKTYKVWLENYQSLHSKLTLYSQKNCGGIAAWRLGYEDNMVWSLISDFKNDSLQ